MDKTTLSPSHFKRFVSSSAVTDSNYKEKLEQLKSHPLFGDLQVTLALDCMNSNIPFSLLSEISPKNANNEPKGELNYSTVSENLLQQHMKLQATLISLRPQFPSLLTVYQQITEQVESQRYRALTFNCYSEHCKQVINWFYDSERQLLIERIQETVNMLVLNGQNLLQDVMALQSAQARLLQEQLFPRPLKPDVPLSSRIAEPERPLDLSGELSATRPQQQTNPDGTVKKSRFLSKRAVAVLQTWYREHRDHPYATDDEVRELAIAGEITPNQVKKWMANTRARSYNTLTYNGGKHGFAGRAAMKRKYFSNKYNFDSPSRTTNAPKVPKLRPAVLTEAPFDNRPSTVFDSLQTPQSDDEEINVTDKVDEKFTDTKNTTPKKSLEDVVERCRAKTASDCGKSAIDSLKDVVNSVSLSSVDIQDSTPVSDGCCSSDSSTSSEQSSVGSKRFLNPQAKAILNDWFRKHIYRPYPTYAEKKELAELCSLSSSKVDTWFANKRNRTVNLSVQHLSQSTLTLNNNLLPSLTS